MTTCQKLELVNEFSKVAERKSDTQNTTVLYTSNEQTIKENKKKIYS